MSSRPNQGLERASPRWLATTAEVKRSKSVHGQCGARGLLVLRLNPTRDSSEPRLRNRERACLVRAAAPCRPAVKKQPALSADALSSRCAAEGEAHRAALGRRCAADPEIARLSASGRGAVRTVTRGSTRTQTSWQVRGVWGERRTEWRRRGRGGAGCRRAAQVATGGQPGPVLSSAYFPVGATPSLRIISWSLGGCGPAEWSTSWMSVSCSPVVAVLSHPALLLGRGHVAVAIRVALHGAGALPGGYQMAR